MKPPGPALVQALVAEIDRGRLNPGDVLDEAELSATYGVSRTPVREAILYLEALGLVRRLSKAGAAALEAAVAVCEAHAAEKGDADPDGYYQLNLGFHGAVAEASGNPVLVEALKTNARKLLAYYRARYRYAGVIGASALDHRAIAGLIAGRQAEAAEAAMQRHVQFDQVTAMDLLAALG